MKAWSEDEDRQLLFLVNKYPSYSWPQIAKFFFDKNSKQCREHYVNYLDPKLIRGPLTEKDKVYINHKSKL